LPLLVLRAVSFGDAWRIVSFSIFGVSMIENLIDYILALFLFGFAAFFTIFISYGVIIFIKIIYIRLGYGKQNK
jgi:hypothetical protein